MKLGVIVLSLLFSYSALVVAQPPSDADVVPLRVVLKAFHGNQLAANAKYKGKVMTLRAKVLSVNAEPPAVGLEDYYLYGDVPQRQSLAVCLLTPSAVRDAALLEPKQEVTVRGRIDGFVQEKDSSGGTMSIFEVSLCEIVKPATTGEPTNAAAATGGPATPTAPSATATGPGAVVATPEGAQPRSSEPKQVTKATFGRVAKGMSWTEVISNLGEPTFCAGIKGQTATCKWMNGDKSSATVWFRDGKVTGLDADRLPQ